MLQGSLVRVDRRALEMGQLALGEHRAHCPGEGSPGHAPPVSRRAVDTHAHCPLTMRPPFMTKRTWRTAETSRVGSPATATRSARRPGLTAPRSLKRKIRA